MTVTYARARSRLLHPVTPAPRPPAAGRVLVDPARRTASVQGRPLRLTRREFDLLAHLVGHPRRVFSRGQLLDAVWGRQDVGLVGDARTVDVHIARLRAKFGPAHRAALATVRGVGYKYEPEPVSSPGVG